MKKKHTRFLVIILLALFAAFLPGCDPTEDPKPVYTVELSVNELELEVGEESTLVVTVFKDGEEIDTEVSWSVSVAGIVSLENGKVTAMEAGTTVITASYEGASDTCSVTVTEEEPEDPEDPEEHIHEYDENGICSCGMTKEGAYAITVDGNTDDWSNDVKAKALNTFGDDGKGLEVMAFTDDDYFFVSAKIVTSGNVNGFEIVYGDGKQIYYSIAEKRLICEEGVCITVYYSVTTDEADLKTYVIEILTNKAPLLDNEGKVKCGFDANVEDVSEASYSETQPNYWVLYGINAWYAPDYMTVDETGIIHNHIYDSNFVCIICGEKKSTEGFAINVDGELDDWDETVMQNRLYTADADGREYIVYGFVDDDYIYIFGIISHYSNHVGSFEILAFANNQEHLMYVINNGDIYTYNSRLFEMGAVVETYDEETLLTTSYFEIVLNKTALLQPDGSVKLGFSAGMNNESSSRLGFSETQSTWWVIAKTNSWLPAAHFTITAEGIPHDHVYDEEDKCYICGEEKPVPNEEESGIIIDGATNDWDEAILATAVQTEGAANRLFKNVGFVSGEYVYFHTVVQCVANSQNTLSVVFNGTTEFVIIYKDGLVSKTSNIENAAVTVTYDEELNVYVASIEYAIKKELITNSEDLVKVGFDIWVSDTDADSTLGFGEGVQAFWWVIDKKNSWSVPHNFVITENGIA